MRTAGQVVAVLGVHDYLSLERLLKTYLDRLAQQEHKNCKTFFFWINESFLKVQFHGFIDLSGSNLNNIHRCEIKYCLTTNLMLK